MKDIETITGYLGMIDRKPSSRNGNPRWMVSISNGKTGAEYECVIAYTTPDSSLGYDIGNYREGDHVRAEVGTHYGVVSLASLEKLEAES